MKHIFFIIMMLLSVSFVGAAQQSGSSSSSSQSTLKAVGDFENLNCFELVMEGDTPWRNAWGTKHLALQKPVTGKQVIHFVHKMFNKKPGTLKVFPMVLGRREYESTGKWVLDFARGEILPDQVFTSGGSKIGAITLCSFGGAVYLAEVFKRDCELRVRDNSKYKIAEDLNYDAAKKILKEDDDEYRKKALDDLIKRSEDLFEEARLRGSVASSSSSSSLSAFVAAPAHAASSGSTSSAVAASAAATQGFQRKAACTVS